MFSLKSLMAVAIAGCLTLVVVPATAIAQQGVCVVDVAEVFKNHPAFIQELESLKQQAEQFKFELQQRGEQLQARSEKLKDLDIGSPEYKQLESELAQGSAGMEVDRRSRTRQFIQTEAELHYKTYVEVTNLISSVCEQRGYRLAVRYNSLPTDTASPESIMQRVNEYVIFHNPQHDITREIIALLNNGQAPRTGSLPANPGQ